MCVTSEGVSVWGRERLHTHKKPPQKTVRAFTLEHMGCLNFSCSFQGDTNGHQNQSKHKSDDVQDLCCP